MNGIPSKSEAIAAAHMTELRSAVAQLGNPLPPLFRHHRTSSDIHLAFLISGDEPKSEPLALVEQANALFRQGFKVTVVSHDRRSNSLTDGISYVQVPLGWSITNCIPLCDAIVVGHWREVLPARLMGIAPVAYLNEGSFCLDDHVPTGLIAFVKASLAAANLTIVKGAKHSRALAGVGVKSEVIAHPEVGEMIVALVEALPCPPPDNSKMCRSSSQLDGIQFINIQDQDSLAMCTAITSYERIAIPVARPTFGNYRIVRWQVAAHNPTGMKGTLRLNLPAMSEQSDCNSPYQFGIDLLEAGLAADAFSWFVGQCQQVRYSAHAVLGRWVVLSLIEAGRSSEALDLAVTFASGSSTHPDYYCLALMAALDAARLVDVNTVTDIIETLGSGGFFDEWFEDPYRLAVDSLVARS